MDPERLPNHLAQFSLSFPLWITPVRIKVIPSVPLDTSSSVDDTRVGMLQAAVNGLNRSHWNVAVSQRFVQKPEIAYEIVRDLAKEIKGN